MRRARLTPEQDHTIEMTYVDFRKHCAFLAAFRRLIRLRRIIVGGLLVACAAGWVGCSKEEPADAGTLVGRTTPSGVKVLLIGVDGATFDIIRPQIARGNLPTFERLMKSGAHGILKSEQPMLSPAIWTTILTGRPRDDHGIHGFKDRQTNELVTSNDRRVLALWNITSAFGLTNGWVSFWATWPAEAIRGWCISDQAVAGRWTEWTQGTRIERATYPEDLMTRLRPLVVDPMQPPMDEVEKLVNFTPEELSEFRAVRKPIFQHWLSVFKFAYCSQRSYEKMALHMLEKQGQPDVMGVFLIANDPISHTFWHFYRPMDFRGVDLERARRLGKLIPGFYGHNDRYIGRLLEKVDADTVVIIVSDHGFQSSGRAPKMTEVVLDASGSEQRDRGATNSMLDALGYTGTDEENLDVGEPKDGEVIQVAKGQSGMHHLDGVFIASGGPILKGHRTEATIADVTPTILALLGLPVARDMPGRVLTDVIEPAFLEKHPVTYIDSYEDYISRESAGAVGVSGKRKTEEMLKSLGYIDNEDEHEQGATRP